VAHFMVLFVRMRNKIVFGTYPVQVSARLPPVLTEVYRGPRHVLGRDRTFFRLIPILPTHCSWLSNLTWCSTVETS